MSTALAWIWGLSAAAAVLAYGACPLVLVVLARLRPRPVRRARIAPKVSLIVPAHDEEDVIAAKVDNCLEVDHPKDALEVIVVSDGSTDRTNAIVSAHADPRVRLLALGRVGKCRALDQAVSEATGEILVLTDANALLERDALRILLEPFADDDVGGVGGMRRCRASSGGDAIAQGEGLYWRYDTWMKEVESRVGSAFASDGSLHALRRSLYVPIGVGDQADDIAISARVVLQGKRLLFEPRAVAWEDEPQGGGVELRRKARIVNHTLRAILRLVPEIAERRRFAYGLELLGHKVARYLVPFFLLAMTVSALASAPSSPAFAAITVLQLAGWGAAAAGAALRLRPAGRLRALSVPYYFAVVNIAALLGVLQVLGGTRHVTWQPRAGADAK